MKNFLALNVLTISLEGGVPREATGRVVTQLQTASETPIKGR